MPPKSSVVIPTRRRSRFLLFFFLFISFSSRVHLRRGRTLALARFIYPSRLRFRSRSSSLIGHLSSLVSRRERSRIWNVSCRSPRRKTESSWSDEPPGIINKSTRESISGVSIVAHIFSGRIKNRLVINLPGAIGQPQRRVESVDQRATGRESVPVVDATSSSRSARASYPPQETAVNNRADESPSNDREASRRARRKESLALPMSGARK